MHSKRRKFRIIRVTTSQSSGPKEVQEGKIVAAVLTLQDTTTRSVSVASQSEHQNDDINNHR